MELRQLQHFVAVAQEMHFSRAAQRLNIVQSALSSSIAMLEQELGVRLFHRTTRQVRLTAAGEAFHEKAMAALSSVREARQAVESVRELRTGTLVIGTVQSLPDFIDLPGLLARFHASYPGIDIRLRQGNKLEMPALLLAGQLDLAITSMMDFPRRLTTQVLIDEPMVLACTPDHRLGRRKRVSLDDLAEEPFVDFQPGWGTRTIVDRQWEGRGARHIAFEVSDLATMMALVKRGLGVAIVPRRIAMRDAALAAVELGGVDLNWGMMLMHRRERDAAVAAFLGMPGLRQSDTLQGA